jgi:hypothetical protein
VTTRAGPVHEGVDATRKRVTVLGGEEAVEIALGGARQHRPLPVEPTDQGDRGGPLARRGAPALASGDIVALLGLTELAQELEACIVAKTCLVAVGRVEPDEVTLDRRFDPGDRLVALVEHARGDEQRPEGPVAVTSVGKAEGVESVVGRRHLASGHAPDELCRGPTDPVTCDRGRHGVGQDFVQGNELRRDAPALIDEHGLKHAKDPAP